MSIYCITYDLRMPGKDYEPLLKAIQDYPHCRCLKSAFFIDTCETAGEVRDKLKALVDRNDQLYVLNMTHFWVATRREKCADWLIDTARTW